ncbi:hypothetical protein [Nocardia sp. NPDC050406]|uniref:hypothetical protein n=1 Tax=Nocardia sp. NPDC050406 TaxID=3364318 RepID=UPI00379BA991
MNTPHICAASAAVHWMPVKDPHNRGPFVYRGIGADGVWLLWLDTRPGHPTGWRLAAYNSPDRIVDLGVRGIGAALDAANARIARTPVAVPAPVESSLSGIGLALYRFREALDDVCMLAALDNQVAIKHALRTQETILDTVHQQLRQLGSALHTELGLPTRAEAVAAAPRIGVVAADGRGQPVTFDTYVDALIYADDRSVHDRRAYLQTRLERCAPVRAHRLGQALRALRSTLLETSELEPGPREFLRGATAALPGLSETLSRTAAFAADMARCYGQEVYGIAVHPHLVDYEV